MNTTKEPWFIRPGDRLFFLLLLCLILSHYILNHGEHVASFVHEASERALYSFAIARGINAVISVIQSAEVGFTLAVSATLEPGQILDPVNDLVERFSLVMLIASSALWIFRFLSELLFSDALLWLTFGLFMLGMLLNRFTGVGDQTIAILITRLSKGLVILLVATIGTALITNWIHDSHIIQESFTLSSNQLENELSDLNTMNDQLTGSNDDECGSLKECATYYADQATLKAENISRNVVIQIAIFVLETLFIPLIGIWLAGRFITAHVIRSGYAQLKEVRQVSGHEPMKSESTNKEKADAS